MKRIYEDVRDSAYQIIERKGATYYGIAMAVARIAESIVKDEQAGFRFPWSCAANTTGRTGAQHPVRHRKEWN